MSSRLSVTSDWQRGLALVSMAALTALSGCMVTPVRPRFTTEAVVVTQPPQPRVEVVGVAPEPGHIWIPGYWEWIGSRHVWVEGRWSAPRAGYYWEPHVWVHSGGGWYLRDGYWARR
jgi:hypothetical protein